MPPQNRDNLFLVLVIHDLTQHLVRVMRLNTLQTPRIILNCSLNEKWLPSHNNVDVALNDALMLGCKTLARGAVA